MAAGQQRPSPLSLSDTNRFRAPQYDSQLQFPSPSPARQHGRFISEELDPLLRSLSPSSTLAALRTNDAVNRVPGSKEKLLADSVAEASQGERALGIRAALAGKKLREWVEELEEWEWPDEKFAPPTGKGYKNGEHGEDASATSDSADAYMGSLQAQVVKEREARVKGIKDDMEMLEVDELKHFVLGAHSNSSSRSSSYSFSNGGQGPSQYNHLNDFTVVITATIVQALPFLARLEKLLHCWSLRLLVLRQIPSFRNQLEDTQVALDSAWTTLKQATPAGANLEITRETYVAIRAILQERVSDLARRIDAILDALEGSQDRLPDDWIDEMEDAEAGFQDWIAEAETLVELNELRKGTSNSVEETGTVSLSNDEKQQSLSNQHLEDDGVTQDVIAPVDAPHTPVKLPKQSQQSLKEDKRQETPAEPTGSSTTVSDAAARSSSERKTPTHGLFFMRNVSPTSPAESKATSPNNLEALSKQAKESTAKILEIHRNESFPRSASQAQNGGFPMSNSRSPTLSDEDITGRKSEAHRPPPLELASSIIEPGPLSDISQTTSESSEAFSNMSSPQIMDASSVQFFKTPMEEKFEPWVTQDDLTPLRHASQRTVQGSVGHGRSVSAVEPIARSRASSHLSDITINGRDVKVEEDADGKTEAVDSKLLSAIRRASTASIESIPRSEVRNVAIRKNSGFKSRARSGSNASIGDAIVEQIAENQKELEGTDSGSESPGVEASPSLRIRKTRKLPNNDAQRIDYFSPQTDESIAESNTEQRIPDDKLSMKINSVLSRVPAPIRLANTPMPKADAKANHAQANLKSGETPLNRVQRTTATPLTLVPANTKTVGQHSDGSDGKLYHLHQPGREIPIKLFIRLVGNEERVMVRVGGGWADLAEYLKEYAIHHQHHGRRAVSDNKFEIKNLPSQSTSAVPTMTSVENGRSPSNSISGGTPGNGTSRTPAQRFASSTAVSAQSSPREQREETPELEGFEPIPMANTERGSSLGLAGPRSRNVEISPQKKAWVEGMLSQARNISYEQKRTDTTEASESSKGGTRRVFMKAKGDD